MQNKADDCSARMEKWKDKTPYLEAGDDGCPVKNDEGDGEKTERGEQVKRDGTKRVRVAAGMFRRKLSDQNLLVPRTSAEGLCITRRLTDDRFE